MCFDVLVPSLPVWALQRAAVYDMTIMRRTTNNPRERVLHAPNVVMLHPDLGDALGSGVKANASSSGMNSREQASYHDASRYLDEHGYDVTPYDQECTVDLEGL